MFLYLSDPFCCVCFKAPPEFPLVPQAPSNSRSRQTNDILPLLLSMYNNHANHFYHEDAPNSFDEFLAQLWADGPTQSGSILPPSSSTPDPTPHQDPEPHLTCQWVALPGFPSLCGAPLPLDPRLACIHFRFTHDVRGNEKVIVPCQWQDCQVPPMQRGSLIRHVLSVHLGLLRWQCEVCGRVFSRRGTGHACLEASGGQ